MMSRRKQGYNSNKNTGIIKGSVWVRMSTCRIEENAKYAKDRRLRIKAMGKVREPSMNPDAVRQRIYRANKEEKVREPSMNPDAVRKRIYRAKKEKEKELAAVATINNGRGRTVEANSNGCKKSD